ncbi:MAG: PAS domain S-box protein [Magnetococcales bacterium]|nr:PAS domain S-box protein [Magnetococcales bacterium]
MTLTTDQRLWSIRRPIIVSFLAAFGLLLMFILFSLRWMHEEEEVQLGLQFQSQVNETLRQIMARNSVAMEGQLLLMTQDARLSERFLAGDREGLLRASEAFSRFLEQKQHVTHLYFHDASGVNFLRVYHPRKFGDPIDRQTLRQAMETRKVVHGVELGVLGTVTQRVVMPWEADGRLIGYLELGQELPTVFPMLKASLKVDLCLFILKSQLDREAWSALRAQQKKPVEWDRFAEVVLAGSTMNEVHDEIAALSQEVKPQIFKRGNHDDIDLNHFHAFVIPIHDIADKRVASLVIHYEDLPLERITLAHSRWILVGIVLAGLVLAMLFYRLLLGVEGRLRSASDALLQGEQRMRAILDTALDAIISIDAWGRILEFNKAAERIFGFPKQEVMGKDISTTIIPPELRDAHRQGMARYLSTREKRVLNQHVELTGIDARGIRIPIEIAITVIPSDGSTIFTAFLRDISDRKQMLLSLNEAIATAETSNRELRLEIIRHEETTARLRSSEERFRSVTLSIRDAIIAADGEQKIVFWNRGAEDLFGYTRQEIFGARLERLIPPCYKDAHREGFERFQARGDAALLGKTTELSGLRKNGEEFPLEMSLNSWTNADGSRFFSAVIRDITERKSSEEALLAAKESAEAANQAKSLFLANMSHEIRTPMNTIIGMGYLLSQSGLTATQESHMRKIQSAAETLLGIINDILDVSKIEAGRLELEQIPFRLREVMDKVAGMVAVLAGEKGLEVLFSLHPDLPRGLTGDPLRLEQVLTNLGSNAVKFTSSGEILFRVEPVETLSDGRIRLRFSVRDSGIGLSEEQLAGLFQPFTQADSTTTRNYGGTGLGLTICKNLVEMMGGDLTVSSAPGAGSEFAFTVLLGRQEEPEGSPDACRFDLGRASPRVLVVDDNETAREILREMVRALSFECVAVGSGEEALREMERARQPGEAHFDVVLLDWQMPGLDGIETARRIQSSPTLAGSSVVIMVTAFGRRDLMTEARRVGIHGFMLKPITPSLLLDTLLDLLAAGRPERFAGYVDPASSLDQHRAALRGARILVVEDHDINWQVAKGILAKADLVVERAVNGEEAVERIATRPDAFDCLLMDLQMPVMDGYEATRRIRALCPAQRLPIIAMTANALKSEREQCLALGMNDYLTKPIQVPVLFATLARILGRHASAQIVPPSRPTGEDPPSFVLEIEGLDTREVLLRLDDDRELLTELLRHYAVLHAPTGERMAALLAEGDMPALQALAHGLKGVSANVSANGVAELARRVEEAAQAGKMAVCEALMGDLRADLERLTAAIRDVLPRNPDDGEGEQLEEEPFSLVPVKELARLLADGDFHAKNLFALQKERLASRMDAASMTELRHAMERLDFAKGAGILGRWLQGQEGVSGS